MKNLKGGGDNPPTPRVWTPSWEKSFLDTTTSIKAAGQPWDGCLPWGGGEGLVRSLREALSLTPLRVLNHRLPGGAFLDDPTRVGKGSSLRRVLVGKRLLKDHIPHPPFQALVNTLTWPSRGGSTGWEKRLLVGFQPATRRDPTPLGMECTRP